MSDCEQRETAAAYVLGALPDDEHEAFLVHLEGCDECREDVAFLQVAADALPLAAVQIAPPPALEHRIMDVVHSEASLLEAAEGRAPDRPERRPRRSFASLLTVRPLATAAAAAVLIAVVVAGGLALTGGNDSRTVQGQVLVASAPRARASVQLSDDATKLTVSDMPAAPAGKVYQVWLKRPAKDPTPTTALFRVDAKGHADVEIQPGRLKGVEQVLVTAEPDGGSMAPTSDPVIAARIA
jgi:anti-sigma-K factor RskA